MSHDELIANMELVMGYSYWADNPDLFDAWEKIPPAIRELQAEIERLRREVDVLRIYGDKDCTAMADEALTQREAI